MTLTFDHLTFKVVSESRVTWATSLPILVLLCLSVLDLGPMYATDVRRQTDVRQKHRLMPPPIMGGDIITLGQLMINYKGNSSCKLHDAKQSKVEIRRRPYVASCHGAHQILKKNNIRALKLTVQSKQN